MSNTYKYVAQPVLDSEGCKYRRIHVGDIVRYYKDGSLYKVVAFATNVNSHEHLVVIYRDLSPNRFGEYECHAVPQAQFLERADRVVASDTTQKYKMEVVSIEPESSN